MMRVGIVAALPAELHPLVREWPRTDHVFIGFVAGAHCFAACEGMGAAAASRSFGVLREAAGELDVLVSYGWAGALTSELEPGQVHEVKEVIDARTGERFATAAAKDRPALRLVTLDHVANGGEKQVLGERYRASLVDMEAGTVGRLARAHGLRFLCLKGISDGMDDRLPDLNPYISTEGQLRTGAFAVHALLRPALWGSLLALGRNSREAAEALARALPNTFTQAGLVS